MKILVLPLINLLLCCTVFGRTGVAGNAADSVTKTGFARRDFVDSSRRNWLGNGPRPIRTQIWYPAGAGGTASVMTDAQQFAGPVTVWETAPVAGNKQYPLIILSHGAHAHAVQLRWLAVYLASRGFIAAVVDHNGTDAEERAISGQTLSDFCMWERPKDIAAALDHLLTDSVFAKRIDTSHIGAAGFSLGGATVLWAAGAVFNRDSLAKGEPAPPAVILDIIKQQEALAQTDPVVLSSIQHSGDVSKDKRIKAVFALSPAIGMGFSAAGLHTITVPVQIAVGDADIIAPMHNNAARYAANIPTARPLIVLPGERGHYTRPPAGNERPAELQEVAALAFRFFNDCFIAAK